MIITVDDPAFTFFIGLCLIRRKREDLLLSDPENIPEIMAKIHFNAEEEIDSIVIEALKLYKTTPRCLLRSLRLCCVSTIELTPALPAAAKSANSSNSAKSKTYVKVERSLFDEHERTMAIQAARSYLMMAPQELVNAIAPMSQRDSLGSESIPAQYVLIDIRSFEESVVSGGGTIPRAIQLEPEFLNRPEAFNIWLQHFDGTRGCNICIIDLPPANWSGMALWRRILLGDGDGIPIRTDFDSIAENERKLLALTGFGKPKGSQTVHKERVSPDEEAAAAALDMNRPAVILALALQRNSFPNVSVLEGGFPALVEQLLASRGSTEPIVINHDQDKWKKFLNMTGRAALVEPVAKKTSQEKITEKGVGKDIPKTVKDLSQLEVYQLALRMAERLGHNSMAEILREKVNTTPGQETPKSSTPISVDSSMPDELSLLI